MSRTIYIDRDRCVGCYACIVACKLEHGLPPQPVKPPLADPEGPDLIRVYQVGPEIDNDEVCQYFCPFPACTAWMRPASGPVPAPPSIKIEIPAQHWLTKKNASAAGSACGSAPMALPSFMVVESIYATFVSIGLARRGKKEDRPPARPPVRPGQYIPARLKKSLT